MSQITTASAPGKIILFGEHSVVYGYPALVIAIDKRAYVTVERKHEINRPKIEVSALDYNKRISLPYTEDDIFIKKQPIFMQPFLNILHHFYSNEGVSDSVNIKIRSDIPRSAGLGSSAAVCVAFAAALSQSFGKEFSQDEISSLAFEGEKIVHGTPSGIDNTIATFGGSLEYQKGNINRFSGKNIQLIIGNTGISRETKVWVSKVRSRYEKFPSLMEYMLKSFGTLVVVAKEEFKAGNLRRLGELMDINHGLLSAIGVSIPTLDRFVNAARTAGAYGAKLTGAGGGGCMFALVDDANKDEVLASIKKENGVPVAVNFEAQGVKIEND
ncbi:MAG: mevalonate kinase [Candidatus Hodarchaeales archaeon]